jgi:uroporphyrinogen-III decarboxylase
MTSRERILATFRGEPVDRYPVWLKMSNATWQKPQPEPYRSMAPDALLQACGCDLFMGCSVAVKAEAPHVKLTRQVDGTITRRIWETPDGTLVAEEAKDVATDTHHPVKYPIETARDLAAFRWVCRDTKYSVLPEHVATAKTRQAMWVSKDAITMASMGPSPLMALVQDYIGLENSVYLMADQPDLFREVLDVMHQDRLRFLNVSVPVTPADTYWLTENTSTTLISPEMFKEICMPHLKAYGDLVRQHNIIPVHHMCGMLNALLELIDQLPAMVNEAYTTRPVGNTSLAEGRKRMPSKALMGGTNATLWLAPAEAIIEDVRKDLANCPDHRKIFLTSAGVLPPAVSFEKAKAVTEAFKAFKP